MILDEITRKQLICYGHVERMDPTRLPKIMIIWKPEGSQKRGRPRRTWKDGMYTAMNGRMEQPKAMEYGSRKASPDLVKPHIYYYYYYYYYYYCCCCCCCCLPRDTQPNTNNKKGTHCCVFVATVVTQTHRSVALYVRRPSLWIMRQCIDFRERKSFVMYCVCRQKPNCAGHTVYWFKTAVQFGVFV